MRGARYRAASFGVRGRPSTDAILICRLTDRPLRPLFPKGFPQRGAGDNHALSVDLENPLDIISINGASLAVTLSDIPFGGPLGATRVGHVDGELVINPTFGEMERSRLDLIVAGSKDGVMMIEAGASELDEGSIFRAIELGQEQNLRLVELQNRSQLGSASRSPRSKRLPRQKVWPRRSNRWSTTGWGRRSSTPCRRTRTPPG